MKLLISETLIDSYISHDENMTKLMKKSKLLTKK